MAFSSPLDSPGRYQALILDFVGVLTEGVREALQGWCLDQGLHERAWGTTLNQHPEGRRLYLALEAGRLTQQEWNRRTAPLLGIDDHENLMGRAWSKVRPAQDMIELAHAARRAGLRTALLSNSFGLDPYDPYRTLGVSGLCEVTVLSEVEGVAKPDLEIYQRTLERLGVPGEKCLFVDDNPANLPPAHALGITTVLADGRPGLATHIRELLGIHDRVEESRTSPLR
ncbi:HAD-IA family hydrolase [Nocardiopsis sp. JB363]|uniref:HAD-IA family hydrolase n=1 Tax=Nocardiopsis sp. JB363 TaxID=1434837 RepID=UPI000B3606BE|nr:HAD-IA family hydrolase [Nocardiopsis sp. JB363]